MPTRSPCPSTDASRAFIGARSTQSGLNVHSGRSMATEPSMPHLPTTTSVPRGELGGTSASPHRAQSPRTGSGGKIYERRFESTPRSPSIRVAMTSMQPLSAWKGSARIRTRAAPNEAAACTRMSRCERGPPSTRSLHTRCHNSLDQLFVSFWDKEVGSATAWVAVRGRRRIAALKPLLLVPIERSCICLVPLDVSGLGPSRASR